MDTDRAAPRWRERASDVARGQPTRRDGADPDVVPEERRATAMARHILRRAGIAPLVPVLAAVLIAAPSPAGSQTVAAPRATATARVVILPSSVRVEAGRVLVRDSAADSGAVVTPQPAERACETEEPVDAKAASPGCRLLVFDLP